MKLIAYTIFVVSVLLLSGFARADFSATEIQPANYQAPIHIADVQTSDGKQLILSGMLPTPCYGVPAASLTADQLEPNTLVLRLSSPFPQQNCIQRLQPYITTVDLATLVRASNLRLDAKSTYTIKTEGYGFAMKIVGSDLTL